MGTILVTTVLSKASTILQDNGTRWPQSELLGYLNEGQRAIVAIKPESGAVTASVQLVAGTRQSIPASGISLLEVRRNMGAAGTTPGKAIKIASREVLDAFRSGWASDTAKSEVVNFMFDPKTPRTFDVYPPQPSPASYVEMVYSCIPTDCVIGGMILLDDIYEIPLLEWVVYRAYLKDAEFSENANLAMVHLNAFTQAITGKNASDSNINPNLIPLPFNPSATGTAKI